MPRFERSRERRGRSDSPRGDSRDRGSFGGSRGGGRDGGHRRYSRDKRDVEMTKVTCSSCGDRCEVPFKPTSSKPVYCSDCFSKNGGGKGGNSGGGSSNQDMIIIKEKLNKIMKALNIE